jgi:hypothetical protein
MGGYGSGRWCRWAAKATTASYVSVSIADVRRRLRLRPGGRLEIGAATVYLTWTPCHYGGERPWFLCPRCHERRGVLYVYMSREEIRVACRCCLGLSFPSQRQGALDRAIERASKIRARLGGGPGIVDPFPPRPKGMKWRRYIRLAETAQRAEARAWGISGAWLATQGAGRARDGGGD